MSALRLRIVRKGAVSGGGGGSSPTFDTRFGTSTDSTTGLITFALNTGAGKKSVYVNNTGVGATGSDANSGLSASLPKATLEAGCGILNGGDRLLLAKSGTYANSTGNISMSGKGGPSKTYPTLVASYDPADPTNEAKIGKMFGPDMPIVTLPSAATGAGVSFLSFTGDDGTSHNLFVQGIEIKYVANDGNCANIRFVGRHDGVGFQNIRLNGVTVSWSWNSSVNGLSQGGHVSRNSSWGQWAPSGNSEGFYFEGIDGLYYQDCPGAHGGWKMGASRDDAATAGGAASLGHIYYYHATCINGHLDRLVMVDSATDGHNVRGSAACTYLVGLDNPIAANFTGTSNSFSEAPSGSVSTLAVGLFMGGDDINTANPRGYGIRFSNAASSGVAVDNLLFIDNPKYGGANNYTIQADASNTGVTTSNVTLNQVTAYGFADKLQVISGTQTITLTWTAAVTDTLASGPGNSLSSAAVFPNAKTRDQVVSALLTAASVTPGASYTARKAQLVNLMLYRPDLDWARYLVSIAFPAFNKTQTLASLSPPNLSAVTPASIY